MSLRPSQEENLFLRTQAQEMFSLHGVPFKIHEIAEEVTNVYEDDSHMYKEPYVINGIFEQFPQVRTLKKLGWYSKEEQDLPWVIFIPFYKSDLETPINLQRNVKVEIESEIGLEGSTVKVKRIASKGFSAQYWVAEVTPLSTKFSQEDTSDEDGTDRYSYLKG